MGGMKYLLCAALLSLAACGDSSGPYGVRKQEGVTVYTSDHSTRGTVTDWDKKTITIRMSRSSGGRVVQIPIAQIQKITRP